MEHDIQPFPSPQAEESENEEKNPLASIRPLPSIRHAHQTDPIQLPPSQILILELAPEDGLPARPVPACRVPALNHEIVDYTVKGGLAVGRGR